MSILAPRRQSRLRRARALTLVEMMVTMSIFSLVIVGVVEMHMFGLRQDQLTGSKLGSSDHSRRAFGRLTTEIKSAKLWRVGNGSLTNFISVPNGTTQQGNALQISLTTDTNSYIRFYFATDAGELRRMQSGVSGYTVIAECLTNTMYFRAEDHRGNVKTDLSYKYVVRIMLQFYQYQYPLTTVGPGHYYDYYKMEFKITPHCPDGA